jgi:dTDP-D-glucose 4,6-dehydratase
MRKGQLHEIYIIGTPREMSVREIGQTVIQIMRGSDAHPDDWIECVEDRAFNDRRYLIDSSKVNELGVGVHTRTFRYSSELRSIGI